MTYFEAYLLTRLDGFSSFFYMISLISGFVAIMAVIFFVLNIEGDNRSCYSEASTRSSIFLAKISLTATTVFILAVLLYKLIPTSKEAAFIYIAPSIVNNEDLQKTVGKIPEISGLGLEYLSEVLEG